MLKRTILEITVGGVLLGVMGIMAVWIRMQRERIRRLQQHCDSWKLLAEHLEKRERSW